MLKENTQPSTIGGIKRLAKQIKKANGVPHTKALDIAARRAKYENFAHARNQLQLPNNQLFLTSYWYDREKRTTGREVLNIELSIPLLKIATESELKQSNGINRFRLAAPDHFVMDDICHSQDEGKRAICKAVRVLRFIETTGLKPCKDWEAVYPDRDYNNKLPKSDHSTDWYDPKSGQCILIDEPYLDSIVDQERAEWARKHNWHLQASEWAGMYFPGMSNMFVATNASTGYDFEGLMAKINQMDYPLTESSWTGTSSKGHDTFYSPLACTHNDKKRAVARGTIYRESSSKTIPMRTWDAPNNERRPNATMPIDSHLLAARLIKAVEQSSAKPSTVNMRLSSIKSKLEDWFFSEHRKDVTNNYDLFYYGAIDKADPLVLQAHSTQGVIDLLLELKALLETSYVVCEPLRRMISKIDTSIKFTSKLQ